MSNPQVIIIGAGAAGLMCAIEAGKRGRDVLILDHANQPGRKILMSGGGRCNFTNYDVGPEHYISHNPHFCKSALSRFTQWDFLALVQQYNIPFHERDHGQLFCDNSARDILDMLLDLYKQTGGKLQFKTEIKQVSSLDDGGYQVTTDKGDFNCESLVIATGGLSIPSMGSNPFGYKIAEQFGLHVYSTQAGLVPFTLQPDEKARYATLTGIAVNSIVSNPRASFRENVLFTHRGLSGPSILQISNYWQPGEPVEINLLPDMDLFEALKTAQKEHPQQQIKTWLGQHLPKRLIATFIEDKLGEQTLANTSHKQFEMVTQMIQHWQIKPGGTEGYRTAEVTLGGVDCDELSSKTMESKKSPGLYFVGEVVDITGWLGGYNFQWAWSSGWCAGQYV